MSEANIIHKDDSCREDGLPLCYDDRHSTAFTRFDRYVFVSYSHCDKEMVYADLKLLYEAGLHFWYDKKLQAGDFWDRSVKEKIESEQCVGALFFTSANTVKSAAVEQELNLCKMISEERGKMGGIFKIIPITLNGGSILQIVREAFLSCSDLDDTQFPLALPQERVVAVLETLSARMLYIGRSADGSHIARIIDELKQIENETGYKLFCGSEEVQKRFDLLPNVEVSDGRRLINFGEYPQTLDEEAPFYLREGISKFRDGKFQVLSDGRAYRFSPLKWQILRFSEDKLTAVTDKVIDFCRSDEIDSLIGHIREVAFENNPAIDGIRVIDFDLIREFKGFLTKWSATDYAERANKLSFLPLYWGLNSGWLAPFYYDSDIKIMERHAKNLSAGVRLVADFRTDELLRYFEGRI